MKTSPTAALMSILACSIGVGCGSKPKPAVSVVAFSETVQWRGAAGTSPFRMEIPAADETVLYRALWTARQDTFLVVLKQSPADLFGAIFFCEVFDQAGVKRRTGLLHCGQSERPFCLLVASTSSPRVPLDYRDRPILCVGFVDAENFRADWPTRMVRNEEIENEKVNVISLDPVRWSADEERFTGGVGAVEVEDTAFIRFAEPGEPPLEIPPAMDPAGRVARPSEQVAPCPP